MNFSYKWPVALLAVAGVTANGAAVRAADHLDSPAASADPTADITDVYAWMSADDSKLNVILNVYPNAPTTAKFSDTVLYTMHVGSRATFGGPGDAMDTDVRCTFDSTQKVSCWVGDEDPALDYVTGDASGTTGLASADGKIRVFTGLRDDPFFFNFTGFTNAVSTVEATTGLTMDAAGCPKLSAAQSMALVNELKSSTDGGAAVNFAAGFRVLSIVVQLDKAMMTRGGPILGILGSTSKL
jgi:hypothetical protein